MVAEVSPSLSLADKGIGNFEDRIKDILSLFFILLRRLHSLVIHGWENLAEVILLGTCNSWAFNRQVLRLFQMVLIGVSIELVDNIDIIIGSETHLSYNISNAEILPPEYSAARKDRDDGYGGVIIIYKRSLIVEEIHHHKSTEIVSIKLETKNNPTIISSCYRPPNCSLQTNESLTNEINALCKKFKNNPIWIGGDFNLPDIDWMTNSIISHKNSTEVNQLYLDTFENRNLVQIVDFTPQGSTHCLI